MSISSNTFNKEYYYNICLGSEEFKKSKGLVLNQRVKGMIDSFNLSQSMDVLEIGCGRGDTTMYIAKKVNAIVGSDYSRAAIQIANNIKTKYSSQIRKKVKFKIMKADNLDFKNNSFDMIIFIDTIDHLNKTEINKTFKEILRVLRPNGNIFIKTCSNRILLDKTYKYYIFPLNKVFTWIDKKIKKIKYESLPHNPRTREASEQHINEPDYFYLRKVFERYGLKGSVKAETGFVIQNKSLRSILYNLIVTLYPFSKYFPLNILFAHSFSATLRSKKK